MLPGRTQLLSKQIVPLFEIPRQSVSVVQPAVGDGAGLLVDVVLIITDEDWFAVEVKTEPRLKMIWEDDSNPSEELGSGVATAEVVVLALDEVLVVVVLIIEDFVVVDFSLLDVEVVLSLDDAKDVFIAEDFELEVFGLFNDVEVEELFEVARLDDELFELDERDADSELSETGTVKLELSTVPFSDFRDPGDCELEDDTADVTTIV